MTPKKVPIENNTSWRQAGVQAPAGPGSRPRPEAGGVTALARGAGRGRAGRTTRRLQDARTLLVSLLALALLVQPAARVQAQVERLPDLGSADGDGLSIPAERRLGESIMRELRADGTVWDDAEFGDFLNRFGSRLTGTGPARGRAFEFFAVRDGSINAFALPGGYIGVHTGLMAAAGSESELASVVGHEMGHVTQHHIARMLRNQKQASMLAMAGMVLGALAMRSNPDAGMGAMMLGDGLATRSILSFSRDAEREADRIGLEVMREGGFNVNGAPLFFSRLQQENRFNEGDGAIYLRTHPVTSERINDLRLRIQQMDAPARALPDSLEFKLLRARARAAGVTRTEEQNNVLRHFETLVKGEGQKDPVAWYGLASATQLRQDWAASLKALTQAETLLGKPHPYLARLRIVALIGSGQLDKADEASAAALAAFPHSRALVRQRAEVLNARKQWSAAISLLRNETRVYKSDTELWRMLGEAYLAHGEKGMSHLAAAEALLVQGLLQPAIEQLRLARNAGDLDFYNGSIADAKLKEAEAGWLQQQRDAGAPVQENRIRSSD